MKLDIKQVVIGGTFDVFHKGHEALLRKAFLLGEVFIGITSGIMAEKSRNRNVRSFNFRKKVLKDFIDGKKVKIAKIEDGFGPTLKQDFDYIVVSPETYRFAVLINKERQKLRKKPIKIVKINFVLAQDKKPISSTRILNGEIDRNGKLLKYAIR